jgi:F420-dependent methylenetetrahydromethanopterin dehydrogenase
MKQLIQIVDSLLYAFPSKDSVMTDPTLYTIETNSNTYCGYIIFQDDTMIKFRTEMLKPVKILKVNIRQITILKQAYLSTL